MKGYLAFCRKEWLEQLRIGRLTLFAIIFVLFGIMNPAFAKMTPWLMDLLSDTLAESGMTVAAVTVDAMTSWTQFYKNIPIVLIIFLLVMCGTLTGECAKGTLIPVLTKGLARCKVILAKLTTLVLLWVLGYALCFGITYGYNAYFWDNAIAQNLVVSALAYLLFGVWILTLLLLFSSFLSSGPAALLGTGGVFVVFYLIHMLPTAKEYLPLRLTENMSLLGGALQPGDIVIAVGITVALCVVNVICSILIFNKRKL